MSQSPAPRVYKPAAVRRREIIAAAAIEFAENGLAGTRLEAIAARAEVSHPRVTVDTAGLSPEATELANLLALEIAHLPPEAVAELLGRLKILRKRA